MTIDTLVAWAEILGAIAVVVSLVYVGRQVQLGNVQARTDAFRAVSLSASELFTAWATDERFIPIARAGIVERSLLLSDLDADDQTRVILHFAAGIRIFETIHRHVEAGVLGEDAYELFGGMIFRSPLFADAWQQLGGAHSEEFARVMEQRFDLPARSSS